MTLIQLNNYFNEFLKKEEFPGDPSLNGIQIENSAPDYKEIKKIAFAVDACEETAKIAAEKGADVLIVHHGLFWGGCQTITGSHYKRISAFMKNDIALIAYHLPLDANNPYGNNFGMGVKAGLENLEPFGTWRGMTLGAKGELKEAVTLVQLSEKLGFGKEALLLPFGKNLISKVGIISGGGGEDVDQAVAADLDCFVTGEFQHEQYHYAKEMKMNVIAAGHYASETMGVSLLMDKVKKELGIEAVFIDLPTNL